MGHELSMLALVRQAELLREADQLRASRSAPRRHAFREGRRIRRPIHTTGGNR